MRFDRAWLVVAVLLVAVLAGAVALHDQRRSSRDVPAEPTLVTVGESETELWPHTSRSRSFAGRTLAMNVVVRGAPDRTRRAMLRRTDANWSRTELGDTGPESVSVAADGPIWLGARGAARYTYVERGDDGRWLRERYQLGVGGYLGQRHHVRAYALDDENWTAMQAHAEHWDWFRLRHTVDDVAGAREYVAADLASVGTDRRETDLGGVQAVVVVLALLPVGALAAGGRLDRALDDAVDYLPLPLALVGLVLGVRLAGVGVEGALPGLSPKVIAGVLYPVLVVGVPLVALRFAGRLPPRVAFALAAGGLWVGLLLDYAFLGVGFVRPPELLHRVALGLAVGLLAAASGHGPEGRPLPLAVGLAGWLVALLLPLFGLL